MSEQIVITEKNSQARDVRAAIGSRYGTVLPAEGHLFDLMEPEDVNPSWKRWSPIVLKPDGLYGTRPATGGNKASKRDAIERALKHATRVWIATDCDREGQLIGQEILEHYNYRGEVRRVMFTAQDERTIRDAFAKARPNSEHQALYQAAVARRQADQIYNLSLTRTATVTLSSGSRDVIGVGRVKTPTLAIVCRRELEIQNFKPENYFEIVARATSEDGSFIMRHAPRERITTREKAQQIASIANGTVGPVDVRVEDKRQAPPRLHDLPSLQKFCAANFGWSASHTLDIAQALYDGTGKKIITYPRAETRFLPESLIPQAAFIVAKLRDGQSYASIPMPEHLVIRRGTSGTFSDKATAGASHHAIIPNHNTIDTIRDVWPRLSKDEKRLFDVIARTYLAAVMPDFRFQQTTVRLACGDYPFFAKGRQPIELGWRNAFPKWQPDKEKGEETQALPRLKDGDTVSLNDATVDDKVTRAPPRYNEGTLVDAMQNAWRFVEDAPLRERLKEAKGIGTPATRAEIIKSLKTQDFLSTQGKNIVPTPRGLDLYATLEKADPALVDPGVTAQFEHLLDNILLGHTPMMAAIDAVSSQAERIIQRLIEQRGEAVAKRPHQHADYSLPTPAMVAFVRDLAARKAIDAPAGYEKSREMCRIFLDFHAPASKSSPPSGRTPAKLETKRRAKASSRKPKTSTPAAPAKRGRRKKSPHATAE